MKKILIYLMLLPFSSFAQNKTLTERTEFICDSLQRKGIYQMDNFEIATFPHYMIFGMKSKLYWEIKHDKVVLFKYLFWKNRKGDEGLRLIKETEIR